MKRANGTGGVVKLSGNRRRPYEARITVGRTSDGKQIGKAIGYYATRDEATAALIDYVKSPYDIDSKQIAMAELYKMWLKETKDMGRLSDSAIRGIQCGYRYCKVLYDLPYANIKAHMMQDCVDRCGRGYGIQNLIKNLFYNLDKYAYKHDIINKKYSEIISIDPANAKEKKIFRNNEVITLWENRDMPWVDTILILLYSGWRISELLGLLKKNVVIDPSGKTVNYMQGGMKTKAGKDRMIPIHSTILPLIIERLSESSTYLIEKGNNQVTYRGYLSHFHKIMDKLGMKHTVHETRHTFATWLGRTPCPSICADRLMGHAGGSIRSRIYTHKDMEELRDAIELIKSVHL